MWDQEPPESRDGQGSYFAVLTCCCRLDTVPTVNASFAWLSGNFWLKCTFLQLAAGASASVHWKQLWKLQQLHSVLGPVSALTLNAAPISLRLMVYRGAVRP